MTEKIYYPRASKLYINLQTIKNYIESNLNDVGYGIFIENSKMDARAVKYIDVLGDFSSQQYSTYYNEINKNHNEAIEWLEEKVPEFLRFISDALENTGSVSIGAKEVNSKNHILTITSIDMFRDTFNHYFILDRIMSLLYRRQYNRLPSLLTEEENELGKDLPEHEEISFDKCVEAYITIVRRDKIKSPTLMILESGSTIPINYWKSYLNDLAFLIALAKKVKLRATSNKFSKSEESRIFWNDVLQNILDKIEKIKYGKDALSHSNVTTAKYDKKENSPKKDPYADIMDEFEEDTTRTVKFSKKFSRHSEK